MLSSLHLVSITPDRAVIGHPPRDKLTAEMALGHLALLFEKTLGRKIAISVMQVKDAPPASARSEPRPSGHAPSPHTSPQPQHHAPTPASSSAPYSAPPHAEQPAPRPAAIDVEAAKAHPLVQRAAELLGAKVVRVNPPPRKDTPSPQQP